METLIQLFRKKMALTQLDFIRSMEQRVNWKARLICIRGPRGTGKTTLLLQHIKRTFGDRLSQVLYVSLDNLYFMDNSLLELAEKFVQRGGTHLFLDEVHKYPNWSQTIKNIYDDYPELSVVFTGSSLLEILNARADLSRRALVYQMQGLSFREYLTIRTGQEFPVLTLEEILSRNEELSAQLVAQVKPFMYFEDYLKTGYYPFFLEGEEDYGSRLTETVNMILDIELPLLRKIETASIAKVKKLLMVIAKSAPFIPNTTELAGMVGVARQTLLSYFNYLEYAGESAVQADEGAGASAEAGQALSGEHQSDAPAGGKEQRPGQHPGNLRAEPAAPQPPGAVPSHRRLSGGRPLHTGGGRPEQEAEADTGRGELLHHRRRH